MFILAGVGRLNRGALGRTTDNYITAEEHQLTEYAREKQSAELNGQVAKQTACVVSMGG